MKFCNFKSILTSSITILEDRLIVVLQLYLKVNLYKLNQKHFIEISYSVLKYSSFAKKLKNV